MLREAGASKGIIALAFWIHLISPILLIPVMSLVGILALENESVEKGGDRVVAAPFQRNTREYILELFFYSWVKWLGWEGQAG